MTAGKKYPDGIYATFRNAVVRAEAEFKTKAVANIVGQAMADDGRLLLELLARKYPKQFGQYRGELGGLKKKIREQSEQIAEMERELEELIRGASGTVS